MNKWASYGRTVRGLQRFDTYTNIIGVTDIRPDLVEYPIGVESPRVLRLEHLNPSPRSKGSHAPRLAPTMEFTTEQFYRPAQP